MSDEENQLSLIPLYRLKMTSVWPAFCSPSIQSMQMLNKWSIRDRTLLVHLEQ